MEYLTLKKWRNYEWRLYPEDSQTEGEVIYKGHKLGLESNLILQIIETRTINKNSFHFFRYDKDLSNKNTLDKGDWIKTDEKDFLKNLLDSWSSALNKLESDNKKFRKVVVTKLFI
jgi:hypothetical protein